MYTLFVILAVITAILLTIVVLIQESKGPTSRRQLLHNPKCLLQHLLLLPLKLLPLKLLLLLPLHLLGLLLLLLRLLRQPNKQTNRTLWCANSSPNSIAGGVAKLSFAAPPFGVS